MKKNAKKKQTKADDEECEENEAQKITKNKEQNLGHKQANNKDELVKILGKQKLDGFWEDTKEIFVLLQLQAEEVFNKKPQELNKESWLTIIVLMCLEVRFGNEQGTWKLIAQKAMEYLEDNNVSYLNYKVKAYEIVKNFMNEYLIGNKLFLCKRRISYTKERSLKMLLAFNILTIFPNISLLRKIIYFKHTFFEYFFTTSILFFQILTISLFFLCFLTDPGTLREPMKDNPNEKIENKILEISEKKVFVLKLCETCKIYKNARTHHCRICDVCIDILDHHCDWLGNCIGKGNRRLFIGFLISAIMLTFAMLAHGIWEIDLLISEKHFFNKNYIFVPIVMVLGCGYISSCLIYLLGFHIILIKNGMTTIEYIKGKFKDHKNPYDQGFWKNIYEICCINKES